MRIIGIDPGTATTGFAILDNTHGKIQLITYGCIKTDKNLPAADRLHEIAQDIEQILTKYKPSFAAVEKLFFQTNVKTAISVAQARGVILQKITEHGLALKEYTPLEMKMLICGYGKADKKMVQQMVKMILNLKQIPKPDDAADAVALGICLANSLAIIKQLELQKQ